MDILVARQPILNKKKELVAYELQFRPPFSKVLRQNNPEHRTAALMLDGFLSIGMNDLTRGKPAFITFERSLLVKDLATAFPNTSLGILIEQRIEPDDEVVAACKTLDRQGYRLVFDDFVLSEPYEKLLSCASIIRIDFKNGFDPEIVAAAGKVKSDKIKLLAKNLNSKEGFELAIKSGFKLFQGDFFKQVEVIAGKDFSPRKLTQLQLLADLNNPDLTKEQLEELFRRDASLSFKLLSYINSAHFGFPKEITSIRRAISLIGVAEAKKLLSLIVMTSMGRDKCEELMVTAVVRASLCETLAPKLGLKERAPELYITGLFSLLDAFLDTKMEDVVSKLPLSEDTVTCLLGKEGVFWKVFELVLFYERAEWDKLMQRIEENRFEKVELLDLFLNAVTSANRILMH